jgi:pimeloyl-ACP methyl ester carboxylesterase
MDVLTAWYQQGVFDSLSPDEKQKQIDAKLHGLGGDYANLLETVSLSQQPDLRSSLTIFENCRYLVGQQDSKFLALASTFGSNSKLEIIKNAGHLLHVEQPTVLANMIQRQRQLWR